MSVWDGSGWKPPHAHQDAISGENAPAASLTPTSFDELVQGPPDAIYTEGTPRHSRSEGKHR